MAFSSGAASDIGSIFTVVLLTLPGKRNGTW
jgi:hypothetical protein